MGLQFKLKTMLTDEHFDAFLTLAADRRATVDKLWAWVMERGYLISRAAVGHYWRRLRRQREVCDLAGYSDDALRARIIQAVQGMSGRDLCILALLALGMAGAIQTQPERAVGDGSKAA